MVTDERNLEVGTSSPTESSSGPPSDNGWREWPDARLPMAWMRSAPWRQAVQRRRTMLHDDLARLALNSPEDIQERDFLIGTLLQDANTASQEKVEIRKWWWGTEVERAWARLREVEERLVDLLPEEELLARAATASEEGRFGLKEDDKRLLHLEALRLEASTTSATEPPDQIRSSIIEVLRASHAQSDRLNQEARYLRNRLLLASCLSVMFAALLVAAQWWLDDVQFIAPPKAWSGPHWQFLLVVMLFGAIGALFTAIPAMSACRETSAHLTCHSSRQC